MRVRVPAFFVVTSILLLGGCPTDPQGSDASPDAVSPGTMTLGTGGVGEFVELSDNDTVLLARGCQGGQHVWMGMRVTGIDTAPALIQMEARRIRDERMMSVPYQVRLTFDAVAGEDYTQIDGLQLVIPQPDEVLNEDIRILVVVTENQTGGASVEAERTVRVEWGDEVCGGEAPG